LYNLYKILSLKFDGYAKIDAEVKAVLDEYWSRITGLTDLKRASDKKVFEVIYGDQKVAVKSVAYDAALQATPIATMNFVN